MRIAIAVHGTRGDVEPCAAVALELQRRGHQVRIAVPPNLVGFVAATGLDVAVPYGVDSQQQLEAEIFRESWGLRNPLTALRQLREYMSEGWSEMSDALVDLAHDADLLLTGTTYEDVAANVAEHLGIPLAALHYFPFRANTQIIPVRLPGRLVHAVWPAAESLHWRLVKPAEDAQRRALGLPATRVRPIRRIIERGAVEIQAYDPLFFPGLAEEWAGIRPVIGGLTLELGTDVDAATSSWIDAGTPPIYFGFGSMPVESPADALAMITRVCADLGERALVCSGVWDLRAATADHVKVVPTVKHAAVFPKCRAVVHHGGAGTTAAGLRAGAPTMILWIGAEQPIWAAQVKRLGVGTAQRFSKVTTDSLREGLRATLTPRHAANARDFAARMTTPAQSVATAADLLEAAADRRDTPVRRPPRRA
ncbi:glycosyltransferase [Mycobacterium manitobense]|uniref:Glycosyltransferase n=1 Tax=[Mycobacterium] manitobense TaxID=190147 RepID=A0A9X2YQR5_9MYCO|nr:glycosyltransferase [[Mycobacterium] manitobense]MCV7171666.1 glycosyltransferase [[Mycobacterium] manitobense]